MTEQLLIYPQGSFPLARPGHDHWGLTWALLCPECGGAIDRDHDAGGDHEAITIQPDRDDYDSPIGTRGGYVRIDLHCWGGHFSR
jgi:hypothetical protein